MDEQRHRPSMSDYDVQFYFIFYPCFNALLIALGNCPGKDIHLTVRVRKRVQYRRILIRRGRRSSWLKAGDIAQALALTVL